MRRLICLILCLMLAAPAVLAEEPASFFEDAETQKFGKITRTYDSPTLKYTVDKFLLDREIAYLTRVWVQDPVRQIRKATSSWKQNVKQPEKLIAKIDGASLAINGSGFISHYGLTLDEDGLQMYVNADNEEVLATNPVQTWSFYVGCPTLRNNEDILPAEWEFADQHASRTMIGRIDRNNYVILTVTQERGKGISLRRGAAFYQEHFNTEWVYNLDGGKSIALLSRKRDKKRPISVVWGGASIVDIMGFTE